MENALQSNYENVILQNNADTLFAREIGEANISYRLNWGKSGFGPDG